MGPAMDEAGDRGVQLEAPVVSPRETREVSFGVIGADPSIGAENVSATTENGARNHFFPEPCDQTGSDPPTREQHVARCEEERQHADDGSVLQPLSVRVMNQIAFTTSRKSNSGFPPASSTTATTIQSEPAPISDSEIARIALRPPLDRLRASSRLWRQPIPEPLTARDAPIRSRARRTQARTETCCQRWNTRRSQTRARLTVSESPGTRRQTSGRHHAF